MSLVTFNNSVHTVYENTPIADVEHLTRQQFRPHGTTSLLDAIGFIIKKAEKVEHSTQPTIVILTDGEENSSKKYTHEHVNDLINFHTDWNFVFLGANQDAIRTGNDLGIRSGAAMTFNVDNIDSAFEGLSAAIGRQMTGEDERVTFTGLERMASQPAA